MEELELRGIWDAYDKKLEKSFKLNLRMLDELQTNKAKSKLNALLSIKLLGVVLGVLWLMFLGFLVYQINLKNIYFSGSVSLIMIITIVAIISYIGHMVLIGKIDYTESITNTQTRLAALQVSTVKSTGIAWLQLPFYTTFFWNSDMINDHRIAFWMLAVPVTALFTVLAVWLFKNISPGNLHKKWVQQFMMIGIEYKYVLSASELLQEIEEFKKG